MWTGDRQVVSQGEFDRPAEGFGLLFAEVAAPVEVQPDLADGAEGRDALGRCGKELLDELQLLLPAGVVIDRRGVQADHRHAPLRMQAAEVEEPVVALGVDGREQQPPDAGSGSPASASSWSSSNSGP